MAATAQQILDGLAEIVNEIAGIPIEDVRLDKSFTDDLDVDALSMVEVVVAAEERFDVKVPDEDAKGLKTVGDAADYILNTRLRCACSPGLGPWNSSCVGFFETHGCTADL